MCAGRCPDPIVGSMDLRLLATGVNHPSQPNLRGVKVLR